MPLLRAALSLFGAPLGLRLSLLSPLSSLLGTMRTPVLGDREYERGGGDRDADARRIDSEELKRVRHERSLAAAAGSRYPSAVATVCSQRGRVPCASRAPVSA